MYVQIATKSGCTVTKKLMESEMSLPFFLWCFNKCLLLGTTINYCCQWKQRKHLGEVGASGNLLENSCMLLLLNLKLLKAFNFTILICTERKLCWIEECFYMTMCKNALPIIQSRKRRFWKSYKFCWKKVYFCCNPNRVLPFYRNMYALTSNL